jgi:hypothetical protein
MKTYQSHGKIQLFAKMPTFKFEKPFAKVFQISISIFGLGFFITSHPVYFHS